MTRRQASNIKAIEGSKNYIWNEDFEQAYQVLPT